jgi:hypothetical protein
MIREVHPGSGSYFFTHLGSRIQGSKKHRIADPQHCTRYHSFQPLTSTSNIVFWLSPPGVPTFM